MQMKKTHHILAIITLGFFTLLTSCSSDDNTPIIEEPVNHLLGKWGLYASDLKVELNGEVYLDFEDLPEEGIEYHFKSDEMVDIMFFDPETGQEEESRSVSYKVTDDKLKIGDTEYTILLLERNTLHINLYYEGYNNTMEAYEKVSITQKLEKI